MKESNEVYRGEALTALALNVDISEAMEIAAEICGAIAGALGIGTDLLAKWRAEAYKSIYEAMNSDFIDSELFAVCDNPKHWHLYKHAKKYRVRKKYRNRLARRWLIKHIAESAAETKERTHT